MAEPDAEPPAFAPDPLGDNVSLFPGVSSNKYEPRVILSGAMREELETVVIVGWHKDGRMFFSASDPDGPECLWLIEKAKLALLTGGED